MKRAGKRVLAPAAKWEHEYNTWEFPEMYAAWPYRLVGVTQPETLQLAATRGTPSPRGDRAPGLCQAGLLVAVHRGQRGRAAAGPRAKTRDHRQAVRRRRAACRYPAFFGPGHDWMPDHNWGGSGMVGLQEMLLAAEPGPRGRDLSAACLAQGVGCPLSPAHRGTNPRGRRSRERAADPPFGGPAQPLEECGSRDRVADAVAEQTWFAAPVCLPVRLPLSRPEPRQSMSLVRLHLCTRFSGVNPGSPSGTFAGPGPSSPGRRGLSARAPPANTPARRRPRARRPSRA